jgi:hypothetical protein
MADQDTTPDREGYEDTRPTGMTVREQERRNEARRRRDPDPEVQDVSGTGTVSDKIEQEMVTGGHGHGGIDDLEIEKIENEAT